MAAPTLSDYIKRKALEVSNLQTLINYYGELYQFYSDKLPDNKYINYLEENTLTEGFSVIPPGINDFLSLKPNQMSLLQPYVRIYKKFNLPGRKTKKIEIPFENKTNLDSLNDAQAYIGEPFPFVSQRFNGPVALLSGISIEESGMQGYGVTSRDTDWVSVNFEMFFQDAKLLFKNWGTKEFPVRYKDLFAVPGTQGAYTIVLEIGYSVPDGADDNLLIVSQSKSIYDLFPDGRPANFDYEESGELSLRFELGGRYERIHDTINILDQKYYKQIKKRNNQIVLGDEEDVSVESFEKEIKKLIDIQSGLKSDLENKKSVKEKSVVETDLLVLKETIRQKRLALQLAKSAGAVPESFPFITALYEAGLIYYFELDNEVYKDYAKKVAQGNPIDVSDINYLPKRAPRTRLDPTDFLKKNNETSEYFSNTLRIKRFNTEEENSSNAERIKYFYFGDLIQVMFNNSKDTGIGQDLDRIGSSEFAFMFGQIMWIKNQNTKILYNILNTPISLDMFLFEINREIYQKDMKAMSLTYFLSVFMKKFFDIIVFSYEKAVAGKQSQNYFGATSYVLDKDKFNSGSKFKRKLADFAPTGDTRDTITVRLITAMPIERKITPKAAKKRNIPTFYIGGPDRGPLKRISFSTSQLPLQAEAHFAKAMRANVGALGESIGEAGRDSVLVSSETRARVSLVGNAFFTPADQILIDSRFVDGGFFTQEASNVLFTGYFGVNSIFHRISSNGEWVTTLNTEYLSEIPQNTSYKAYAGEVPKTQNVDIADGANLGRQEVLDTSQANSNVNKKDSSSNAKAAASGTGTPTPVSPPTVPKK